MLYPALPGGIRRCLVQHKEGGCSRATTRIAPLAVALVSDGEPIDSSIARPPGNRTINETGGRPRVPQALGGQDGRRLSQAPGSEGNGIQEADRNDPDSRHFRRVPSKPGA